MNRSKLAQHGERRTTSPSDANFAALRTAYEGDRERAAKLAKILLAQAKLIADLPLDDPSAYAELVCGLF